MVQNDSSVWKTSLSLPITPDSKYQALERPIEMIGYEHQARMHPLPELLNISSCSLKDRLVSQENFVIWPEKLLTILDCTFKISHNLKTRCN